MLPEKLFFVGLAIAILLLQSGFMTYFAVFKDYKKAYEKLHISCQEMIFHIEYQCEMQYSNMTVILDK